MPTLLRCKRLLPAIRSSNSQALQAEMDQRWQDIDKTHEGMESGDHSIWELPPIIERTRAAMKIQPGSSQDALIQGELEYRASRSFWQKSRPRCHPTSRCVTGAFHRGSFPGLNHRHWPGDNL